MIKTPFASEWDVQAVARELHPLDKQEFAALSGGTYVPDRMQDLRPCRVVRGVTTRGEMPVALFGCDPDPKLWGCGVVWMLTTLMPLGFSRDILKEAPTWFAYWLARYPKGIHNIVDSRNTRHVKWLHRMGFEFPENRGVMIGDVPFLYFRMVSP